MADYDDVPFNRDFPLRPGVADEVRPGVRRILCNNPSPFTFTGTLSYIVGRGKVAIIDPGPDNEAHAAALLDAVRGETVTHILVTHTHRDHSPNTARIKAATGATVYAEGPHRASRPRFESEKHNPESGADRDFKPDVAVRHGEVIEGADWKLEAVATPGHTANHLAFAWPERKINFVGDHVMGWSTSIVAPPDGSMIDYMASLDRLTARDEDLYFSGHGLEIPEGPRYVRFLIRHRQAREASILHRLAKGEADFWDSPSNDVLPILEKDPGVVVGKLAPYGNFGFLRVNSLFPPFNNAKARQALAYAFDQRDFMSAAYGDPKWWKTCYSYFICGAPYGSA